MVSLKDISARCGVSIATVSKALNNQQDISIETRERIRSVAAEMGYMANAAARMLKTNRSYNIGVLFVDRRSSGLAHEFFSTVLDSVRVEAERRGYDITFINENVGNQKSSYLQHCLYRGVDGVVIACGASEWNGAEDNRFEAVFDRADTAMYENKTELKRRT